MELNWFTTKFALAGIAVDQADKAEKDLVDELTARPHLRNIQVFWDAKLSQMVVYVDSAGLTIEHTSRGMLEEMKELISAIFERPSKIHIELLEAYATPSSHSLS